MQTEKLFSLGYFSNLGMLRWHVLCLPRLALCLPRLALCLPHLALCLPRLATLACSVPSTPGTRFRCAPDWPPFPQAYY